jgi:antitoxin YefM
MELLVKRIQISEDIIPIGEFKTHASALLKELKESHRSLIITQNGKPAGIVLSPKDYDFLLNRYNFINSVFEGLKDSHQGNTISDEEFKGKLESYFGNLDS